MSMHVIKVPDVGEGIAEVELVAWHVAPGDAVAEDQVIADVMTDKANVQIPSPVAGRVLELGGEVGRMLAVGSELIRIERAGAQTAATSGAPAAQALARAPAAATATPSPAPEAASTAAPTVTPAAPVASATATALPAHRAVAAAGGGGRPLASPAVRQRARELGIDLHDVHPSGPGGRIVHADVDAALQALRAPATPAMRAAPVAPMVVTPARAALSTPEPSAVPSARVPPATPADRAGAAAAAVGAHARRDDETTIQVIGLRRRIAMQMQEAKRRIPHFSYVEELDVTEVEALRAQLNERWAAARGRLTLLPLLMRAVVLALRAHPKLNARFDDDAGVVTQYGAVHLGIATQTPHGLLVPVVHHAETMDLWALAAQVSQLAELARAGRATRAELSGSTITLSSLGALGGIASTPVINRPEVAIVGVNRIVDKPVVRAGAVVVRQTMNLSSSFDHRIVDGADAAAFVQSVRALLETPALLFVE
ncbi:MAG: 2-oxo acid dehydrogenase subunit E2 [Proteobacteria bacterium]|nr:2-oxo acid dehydrogenase subunit E2 [Pseudomonadota bacterium]